MTDESTNQAESIDSAPSEGSVPRNDQGKTVKADPLPKRVLLVPFPKFVFMYPTLIISFIAAIVLQIAGRQSVSPDDTLAVVMTGLFFFLVYVGTAFYTAAVADSKGFNTVPWFFSGLLLGPFALIAAAGLGDRRLQRYIRLMAENQGVDFSEAKPAGNVAQDIIKKKRGY